MIEVSNPKSYQVTNSRNNDDAEKRLKQLRPLRRFSREEIKQISQSLNSLASQPLPLLKENIRKFMDGIVKLGSKNTLPSFSREILNQFCGAGPLSEITFLFLFPLLGGIINENNPVMNDS